MKKKKQLKLVWRSFAPSAVAILLLMSGLLGYVCWDQWQAICQRIDSNLHGIELAVRVWQQGQGQILSIMGGGY